MGHEVTSRWLYESPRPSHITEEEYDKKTALVDLLDICSADLFLRFSHDISATGGADFEAGFAVASGKLFWVVGGRHNIFYSLADKQFESWEQARDLLKEMV